MKNQTLKVGTHRGNKRVWMQGKNLNNAGFKVGVLYTTTIFWSAINSNENTIILKTVSDDHAGKTRKVSKKKAGGVFIPVIDMNSKVISTFFEGLDSCAITFGSDCIIIGKSFDDTTTGPSVRELIDQGYLTEPTIDKEGV